MRCERVKELILTDYADGELDSRLRDEIDAHIGSCRECLKFKAAVDSEAIAPLRAAGRAEAPSYIWERVKRDIMDELPERRGLLAGISELIGKALAPVFNIPRPAVAFIAAAAVVAVVIMIQPIDRTRAANEYLAEQMEFIMKLDSAEVNGNGLFSTEINMPDESLL